MLDFITRYISTISIAIVAALSVFNIGYFWKLGFHFIGLFDLSNLVYSAGLALTAIVILPAVASFVVPRTARVWKLVAVGLLGGALSIWEIWKFTPRSLEPELAENAAILIGFAITGSAALRWVLQRYGATRTFDERDLALLLLFAFTISFQAGSFVAAVELSDRFTYSVSTKTSGDLHGVRVLRASSSGFILVVDDHLIFIPQAEVTSVKSD